MTRFDLASLAKPLVTAPLAHAFLDLDADRRWVLGFHERESPLTVRQLLSHSTGLPPWRPYTGEPLAEQLRRPVGDHALLREAPVGTATYSDLNYRLLAELVSQACAVPFQTLAAAASGLMPAPWPEGTHPLPPGQDQAAWALATDLPFPEADPTLPHDANARAGMEGHAGWAASPSAMKACLRRWVAAEWPTRMAVDTAQAEDGARWGLGLQRVMGGPGRFGTLLDRLPLPKNVWLDV